MPSPSHHIPFPILIPVPISILISFPPPFPSPIPSPSPSNLQSCLCSISSYPVQFPTPTPSSLITIFIPIPNLKPISIPFPMPILSRIPLHPLPSPPQGRIVPYLPAWGSQHFPKSGTASSWLPYVNRSPCCSITARRSALESHFSSISLIGCINPLPPGAHELSQGGRVV